MIELIKTWGNIERPWGYEVRADYRDDAGKIINEVLTFDKEPEKKILDTAVEDRRKKIEAWCAAEDAKSEDYLTEQEKQAWAMVEAKVVAVLSDVKSVSEISSKLESIKTATTPTKADTEEPIEEKP